MALTAAKQALLRRPFTAAAVRFRPAVKKPDRGGGVRCLTYIDSRLAAERLTEVDPAWEFDYTWEASTSSDVLGSLYNFPVRGILTVDGITRRDVGQNAISKVDDKYAKSAVSDALKRVAVLFGIGAYLYALGEARVSAGGYWTKDDGSVGGLNEQGTKELRDWYQKRITMKSFVDRFGKPVDYGDVVGNEPEPEPVPAPAPVSESEQELDKLLDDSDETMLKAMVAIQKAGGGKSEAASRKWAKQWQPMDALGITIKKAAMNKKVDRETIAAILADNSLDKFIETFDATEVPGAEE